MHILLTNDDGIEAPGLAALERRVRPLGRVTVVAPEAERSGTAHSVTIGEAVACRRVAGDGPAARFAVAATPADCVKLAVSTLATEPIDLVISGINAGANVGVSVLYSGTVAAAIEAAMCGLPAVAVSLADREGRYRPATFERAAEVAVALIEEFLRRGLVGPTPLNVNVPVGADGWPLGWRVARQSVAAYVDRFEEDGAPGLYRMAQGETRTETDEETDLGLVRRGYVTVTPLGFDLTHGEALAALRRSALVSEEEA